MMQKTRNLPRPAASMRSDSIPHSKFLPTGERGTWSAWGWLALIGGICWLFGSVLIGEDRLAFRDVGHFYQPLYEYLSQQAISNGLPLWNPLDHSGIPVLGETTTAMFYPLRWLFLLPWPTSVAMGVYVALHLVIAAYGTYWSAKRASCHSAAAFFASIAYTFSCPILFLHTNPPFLVGAAWLPWMLTAGVALLEHSATTQRRQRLRQTILTGYLFAMPVLGGDPQTAVHVGILLGIIFAGKVIRYAIDSHHHRQTLRPRIVPLALAILFAIGIALPQIAASLDWAAHSARRHGDQIDIYAYSVAPWHWLDLWVPFANGQLFPQYQRISHLIPSDMQVWSISLYCGIGTISLCLWRYLHLLRKTICTLFRRQTSLQSSFPSTGPTQTNWSWWDLLLPVGASMTAGHFGVGWWLQQVTESPLPSPAYGPYWMLVEWFPGYDAFRYPAKWLPVAVLGIAITAGLRLSAVSQAPRRRRTWQFGLILSCSLLLIGCVGQFAGCQDWLLAKVIWTSNFPEHPNHGLADSYWGPLNLKQSIANWSYSFLHAGTVLGLGSLTALRWFGSGEKRGGWGAGVAAGLLLVDLVLINSPLIAVVNRSQVEAWKEAQAEPIAVIESPSEKFPVAALRTGALAPTIWSERSGRGRIAEVAASEELGLQGRWHLPHGVRVWNSATSITPDRHQSFAIAAQNAANQVPQNDQSVLWHSLAKHWSLTGYLHTSADSYPTKFQSDAQARLLSTKWIPIDSPKPAVYWSTKFQVSEVQGRLNHRNWQPLIEAVYGATNHPESPYLSWQPFVEIPGGAIPSGIPITNATDEATRENGGQQANRLAASEPHNSSGTEPLQKIQNFLDPKPSDRKLALQLTTADSGLLVRSTFQDGNWQARYRSQDASSQPDAWKEATVYPVDYLHQGILLPSGSWEVEFWYSPWWLTPALGIAIVLLLGSVIVLRDPQHG
ncbi:hypothetical protein FF011L_36330 [Roseimaritima multifibrata]|uniref:Bacterial membrane protein YfhO n=1 Tax=Roseimaritima multifibrata TaxID=1930274 RepID=A0A517MIX9_9BACT|nr:hypothetical protein [Roseimaritima multifibrata]QDS94851.1 hypothetical protein FF011L_36330 [Roseimaritima multifibrata]